MTPNKFILCGFFLLSLEATYSIISGGSSISSALSENANKFQLQQPSVGVFVPNIPSSQLDILQDLYDSTDGEHWIWIDPTDPHSTPWNFTETDPNPCIDNWEGVTCNKECVVGLKDAYCVVTALGLNSHNLTGTLPESLGDLTTLDQLKLADNNLQGHIPVSWSALVNITSFDVSGNIELTGSIPDVFATWHKLSVLDISKDRFKGTIPDYLYNLTTLTYLDMSLNDLDGTLSNKLCSLKNLQIIHLNLNKFTGSIPDCIGDLQVLEELAMGLNSLTGTLPESITTIQSLGFLDIRQNALHGTISNNIGKLTNLTFMGLQLNIFSGTFPSSVYFLNKLDSLLIFGNNFVGPVPNISSANSLSLYIINNNQFEGSITTLNMTRMFVLSCQTNFITGPLPPVIYGSRELVGEEFLDGIIETAPIISRSAVEEIVQFVEKADFKGNYLYYVNTSANFFTGELPTWIFTSPVLALLYMYDNMLSGPIPDVPLYATSNETFLAILFLDSNHLIGSIPNSIVDQHKLQDVRLSNNGLTGTIPVKLFANNPRFGSFAVENNYFTGPLPPIANISLPSMKILSFGDNQFTGPIYNNYSNMPLLEVFAINTNCLSGTIPESLCQSIFIRELIMDGLSSTAQCRQKIFPRSPRFTAFLLKHGMVGTIPACLYEMPFLDSLYLSGNLLHGSVPSNISISNSLINLRLSYNRLTGTIPEEFQGNLWQLLDLSYNKFEGHLMSDLFDDNQLGNLPDDDNSIKRYINTDKQALYLDVNRLSGEIPSSLKSMDEISILNDNIFYCDFSRRQLPQQDPKYSSYSCASESIYESIIGFGVFVFCLLVCIICLYHRVKRMYHDFYLPLRKLMQYWNRAFQLADHRMLEMIICKINSSAEENEIIRNSQTNLLFSEGWKYFHVLRFGAFVFTMVCICVYLPVYCILNVYESMYERKYGWIVSAIFMTGKTAGITLLFLFITSLILLYIMLPYQLKNLSKKNEEYVRRSRQNAVNKYQSKELKLEGNNMGSRVISTNVLTTSIMNLHNDAISVRDFQDSETSSPSTRISTVSATSTTDTQSLTVSSAQFQQPRQISAISLSSLDQFFVKTEPKQKRIMAKIRTCLNYFLVGTIDVVCMTALNIGYVTICVYVKSQAWIVVAQIVVAIVKVWWNEVLIWYMVGRTKVMITYWMDVFKIYRDRYGCGQKSNKTRVESNSFSTNSESASVKSDLQSTQASVKPFDNSTKKIEDSGSFRLTSNDVYLVVCCLLFNNIIAPCIGIAIVSPLCFYNALFAQEPISASYIYCIAYSGISTEDRLARCTREAYGTTTFTPPFVYSFMCSSKLLVNYVVVFIYMTIMSGYVIPTVRILMKYLYDNVLEKGGIWHQRLRTHLPLALCDMYANPQKLPSRFICKVKSDKISGRNRRENTLMNRIEPLFDKHRFIVRCIGFLALLVSFGVVFPPLGAVAAGAICYYSFCEQMNIGRLLHEADELGYGWYLEKLGDDLEGMVEFFVPALFPMVMIGSFLFAGLLFDTFGDEGGAKIGTYPAIVLLVFPIIIWGVGKMVLKMGSDTSKDSHVVDHDTEASVGVEMRPTNSITENPIHSDFSNVHAISPNEEL